jgi:LysR family nitrogen assimilation transcriptional regulator
VIRILIGWVSVVHVNGERWMNLRDLMDVKAICDAGSFRKAAAVRGVTQPTLSSRIAHLEDQLGAVLFERSRGQSRPTELARFISARTGGIAENASLLSREITRLASGQEGTVRIGFGPGPMRALMRPIVEEVSARYPKLGLEVLSSHTRQLGDWLIRREIDLAVCPPIEPPNTGISVVLQFEDENVVVAHPDHPMFRDPVPSLQELFQYPIALPFTEPRYVELLRTHFGVCLDELPGRLVVSDYELLVQMVADQPHFFTGGPRFAFAREIHNGRLRELQVPVPFMHIVAMHVNDAAFPLPAAAHVQQIVGKLLTERLR